MAQHLGRKTSRQGIPWQRQQLFQLADTHAPQTVHRLGRQPAAVDRQLFNLSAQCQGVSHRQAIMHIGQCSGSRRIGRYYDTMLKTQFIQLLAQTLFKTWPGPEQSHAGFHLQQQSPGVIQTDVGTEAVGPGGQKMMPVLDLLFIVIGLGKAVGQGLGSDQAHARLQPQLAGFRVQRADYPARRQASQQHQGPMRVLTAALYAVQCQLSQQNTGPAHALPQRYWMCRRQGTPAFQYPHLPRPGIHRQSQCRRRRIGCFIL